MTASRLRSGDLDAPFHGVRAPAGRAGSFRERVHAALPRLRTGDFFSHLAALALVGADVVGSTRSPVDVSSLSPLGRVRAAGFRGHEISDGSVRLGAVGGFPAVHPIDAWCQMAAYSSVTELVLIGDALVRRQKPIAQRDDLRDAVERWTGHRGVKRLREAETLVRDRTDSPRETRLRLAAADHGLPEPVVNFPVYDERGVLVAILDLAYPGYRVGLEYDGDHHRTDTVQYFHDLERLDALSRLGWRDIRITKEHRGDRLFAALDRVRAALRDRGWSGPARPATRQKARFGSSTDRIR